MNIAKIVSIKPDGKPWESQYGMMYPFYIIFDDHQTGTVNSKSETPAYKVGDMVGYDLNGNTPKGVAKLKITRNPKPGEGTVTSPGPMDSSNPDLEAAPHARPVQGIRPSSTTAAVEMPHTPLNGQTVGMAVKAAVDIWIATAATTTPWNADATKEVEIIARQIVGVSERIQSGAPVEEEPPF
jgi:hypothetical protein